MKKIMISACLASSLVMAGGDIAPVEEVVTTPVTQNNAWQNEFTIYGWYAGMDGETILGPPHNSPSIDASDILDKLEMVFMGTYSGRGDKWSFYVDGIYLGLGESANKELTIDGHTAQTHIEMDVDALLINTGIGYNVSRNSSGLLDLVAGIRYMDLEATVDTDHPYHSGQTSDASKDFLDFVIGARGYTNINEKWFVPYALDIGTGDSDLTWQVFAGVGYRYDWGDLKVGYRYISYDFDDSMFLRDLDMSGAIMGASFKF